jgi:two-component system LytT family response regulator
VNAIIVDDERLARAALRELLGAHPGIQVVGEAATLREARALLRGSNPDVVFADIQLGNENGFDLLATGEANFKVVFVTAYDEYAIRAFEVNAIDYLLKPVNPQRLEATLRRLVDGSGSEPCKPLKYEDRVLLERGHRAHLVPVPAIQCIVGAGDYSEIWVAHQGPALNPRPLRDWERRLPPGRFLRVHRSTIVNLDWVEYLEPSASGGFTLRLRERKQELAVSRRYAAKLREEMA